MGGYIKIGKVDSWRRCGQSDHSNRSIHLSGCIGKRSANTTDGWDRNLTTASFPCSLRYRFQLVHFLENYSPFWQSEFFGRNLEIKFGSENFWLIIEISQVGMSQVHFQIYVKRPMISMKSSFIHVDSPGRHDNKNRCKSMSIQRICHTSSPWISLLGVWGVTKHLWHQGSLDLLWSSLITGISWYLSARFWMIDRQLKDH